TATVDGTFKLPNTTPLVMPREIIPSVGGDCVAEPPYKASHRTNNGFCDYSVHFTVDQFNTDDNNKFYTAYPKASDTANGGTAATEIKRRGTFNYQSMVGAFGVNALEGGTGGG